MNIDEIAQNMEACEKLGTTLMENIETDSESARTIGYYLLKAYQEDSVDNALIAICGWSLRNLILLSNGEEPE